MLLAAAFPLFATNPDPVGQAPSPGGSGYVEIGAERFVLSEVNGQHVRSLRHLIQILRDDAEVQVTLKFARASRRTHETMVFDRVELLESTAKIIEENGIRYPYSPDLRPVWEKSLTVIPKPAAGS